VEDNKLNKTFGVKELLNGFALTLDEACEQAIMDGIAPAICTECGYITEIEPDQDAGYCESCGKNKVKAITVLLKII